MVQVLDNLGFFTYLAYFLLLILLYYVFKHLVGKYAEKYLEEMQKGLSRTKKMTVFRVSLSVIVIICILFLSLTGRLGAATVVFVFALVVLFLLTVADTMMIAAILSAIFTILLYILFSSVAGGVAAFVTVLLLVIIVIFFLVVLVMKLIGVDVLSFFQK